MGGQELSDNPREPAAIPLINPSTPHTSISSTTHYMQHSLHHPHHCHPLIISSTIISTSINTPKLVKTSLQTIPRTISTTTTSFLGPVTLPTKQPPSEKKTSIKEICLYHHTKGMPTNIRHIPFHRLSTQMPKKVQFLIYTTPDYHLTTSPTSYSKSFTSISTTITTKPPPKSKISLPNSPKPTLQHSTVHLHH